MMTALSLVNFSKDLHTFLLLNTALEHSGCTFVVNFSIDDGVDLGSSNDAPSLGFIFWQLSLGEIFHDWLGP